MGHNVVIAYLWVVVSMGAALNLLNAIVIWLQMKQLKENIKDHTVIYVSISTSCTRVVIDIWDGPGFESLVWNELAMKGYPVFQQCKNLGITLMVLLSTQTFSTFWVFFWVWNPWVFAPIPTSRVCNCSTMGTFRQVMFEDRGAEMGLDPMSTQYNGW